MASNTSFHNQTDSNHGGVVVYYMGVHTLASLLGSAALVLPIIFARAAKVENVFEVDTAYAGFSEVLVRANGNLLASDENDNHI